MTPSAPAAAPPAISASHRVAAVRLFNPTQWSGATVVEMPVGNLGAGTVIDWRGVRLRMGGKEIAFAIREGRPHWRASLTTPTQPRTEDLLVFSCTVPPGKQALVEVVAGVQASSRALRRREGRLEVSYPGFTASVDAATGMLRSVRVAGVQALARPMSARAWLATPGPVRPGDFGAGPEPKAYPVTRTTPLPELKARPTGAFSTGAMTEVHFLLTTEGLALGLTYRFHAAGLVEVLADERPWKGPSPWTSRAVNYRLDLAGDSERAPMQENRAPLYGYRDFAAAVRYPASVHTLPGASVVALGEDFVNGRRWSRSLYLCPGASKAEIGPLLDMATEGLVVTPEPVEAALHGLGRIFAPPGCEAAADVLRKALAAAGMRESTNGQPEPAIHLTLAEGSAGNGISGDGFVVQEADYGGLSITAATRFGLLQAAYRVGKALRATPTGVAVPLIASNPTVDLRAGGFGGGGFEVDFPYGDDAEWERVLGELAASGMNVMGDLGMWGNWKMPVSYREMPELRSSAPDAYDEVSGAKFSEFDQHRERGQKLLKYLHDRGVRVWIWLPIGAVPTTYAAAHPEAMSPTNAKTPCFTHPLYQRYLEAFLKELLETYRLDGVVMIRDDNGGTCECDRCKAYLKTSRTQSPPWEQYLILYDRLRRDGFKGEVAVYPYNDHYDPHLEPLLPTDLLIVGHGAGLGVLSRSYEQCAPMGDTWIDNPLASFRLAGLARMRKLLADRPSFWIGGAYQASELPWLSVGRFGWDASCSVNTIRWEEGTARFGPRAAMAFVRCHAAYDRLAEFFALPMLPLNWIKLTPEQQRSTANECREWGRRFRAGMDALEKAAGTRADPAWLAHMRMVGAFYTTNGVRLERLTRIQNLAKAHRERILAGQPMPAAARKALLDQYAAMWRDAAEVAAMGPATMSVMVGHTVAYSQLEPGREWGLQPWGYYLDWALEHKQFTGSVAAPPVQVTAGRSFTLRFEICNKGIMPWSEQARHRIDLGGDAAKLGMPANVQLLGEPVAPGDTRTIEVKGVAPAGSGQAEVTVGFFPTFATTDPTMRGTVRVTWGP